jgi:hypothetical protein
MWWKAVNIDKIALPEGLADVIELVNISNAHALWQSSTDGRTTIT